MNSFVKKLLHSKIALIAAVVFCLWGLESHGDPPECNNLTTVMAHVEHDLLGVEPPAALVADHGTSRIQDHSSYGVHHPADVEAPGVVVRIDDWPEAQYHHNGRVYTYDAFHGNTPLGPMDFPETTYVTHGSFETPGSRGSRFLRASLHENIGKGGISTVYAFPDSYVSPHFVVRTFHLNEGKRTSRIMQRMRALENFLPRQGIAVATVVRRARDLLSTNPYDRELLRILQENATHFKYRSVDDYLALLWRQGICIQRRMTGDTPLGQWMHDHHIEVFNVDRSASTAHIAERRHRDEPILIRSGQPSQGTRLIAVGTGLPTHVSDHAPQVIHNFFDNMRRIDPIIAEALYQRYQTNFIHSGDGHPVVEGVDIGPRVGLDLRDLYNNCFVVNFLNLVQSRGNNQVVHPVTGQVVTLSYAQSHPELVVCVDI